MSNQVVFTKREVEEIRDGLLALESELIFQVSNQHGLEFAYNYPEVEYARAIMKLLDLPHRRPKVPIKMLQDAAFASHGLRNEIIKGDEYDFDRIIRSFGFDVED